MVKLHNNFSISIFIKSHWNMCETSRRMHVRDIVKVGTIVVEITVGALAVSNTHNFSILYK